ncbi:hypothetical protein HMPREF9098_0958 [Kingella denitrificans ATCC 33394]|uniref:Uncharacterized protein n=1 Tax=Kingella denitrificans ATCC 33394 TaxID=888741 RepID=F0EYM4_9NEIS|nr:hypothetical protein HMPREF9098_0958 [Kingella denitrificans ATCC 33394]
MQAALVGAGHAFGQPEARECRLLWKNRIGIAAEPVPFSFGGTGGQTLTKQVEL